MFIEICFLVRTTRAKSYTADKDSDEDDEESAIIDAKIQKELQEIQKIQDSAMAKVIAEDLTEQVRHHVAFRFYHATLALFVFEDFKWS